MHFLPSRERRIKKEALTQVCVVEERDKTVVHMLLIRSQCGYTKGRNTFIALRERFEITVKC